MKKSRKRLIAWMLAAVMALTCGSGAAFADEVQTEGEGAAGEAVSVEAEQPGVSQEDENTDVSQEDENFGDGEPQTEETDNARLGDGSEAVYVDYVGYAERLTDNTEVCPGETAGFTTRVYRYESGPDKDLTSTRIYDYTVEWNIVQINDEIEGEKEIKEYTILSSKDGKSIEIKVNKTSPVSHFDICPTFRMGDEIINPEERTTLNL